MVRAPKFLAALAFLAVPLLSAPQAGAACQGLNLLDLMPGDKRASVTALADAHPFPSGNYWQAEREGARLTIIGTYHLDDPRHAAAVARFTPEIAEADLLLVEAGPEEEKALQAHIGRDPSIIVITEGPTLNQILPPETWERLKIAAQDRGVPPFMAAKFRPWYISVLLAVPPCGMEAMANPNGLDHRLIKAAEAAGTPVRALEPYDTVFSVFGVLPEADQVAMIEQTLMFEDSITDFSETLADMYFDGDNRMMWELMRQMAYDLPGYTREQVDAEMAVLEETMMNKRNRAWIPVIEAAAADGRTVVAFGALHLSGEEGVLNLLKQNGWTLTPLSVAP